MANRTYKPRNGLMPGRVTFDGVVVTSTSGAIASTSIPGNGFTIVKTPSKTGRYTVTLTDSWMKLVAVDVTLTGLADAAVTAGKGVGTQLRNVSVGPGTSNSFQIQFLSSANADAEIEDASSFFLQFCVSASTLG